MTIPEQIQADRTSYFQALDAADKAWHSGKIDVSVMEDLVSGLLARQLTNVFEKASGEQVFTEK